MCDEGQIFFEVVGPSPADKLQEISFSPRKPVQRWDEVRAVLGSGTEGRTAGQDRMASPVRLGGECLHKLAISPSGVG